MSKSAPVPVTLGMLPKKTILKQSVGVDMSKDKFQCCFAQRQLDKPFRILSSHSYACNEKGYDEFVLWLEKHRQVGVELHIFSLSVSPTRTFGVLEIAAKLTATLEIVTTASFIALFSKLR